jgi:tetratricopeptide (TPR) repeat protein
MNRYQEAKELIAEARDHGIDNRDLRLALYTVAFIQGNPAGMIEQVRWASGKPDETFMLAQQAGAAAVLGQMSAARGFYRQAFEAARRHELKSAAAELAAEAGRWEAFFGNNAEACNHVENALSANRGWRVLIRCAMILAKCGRIGEAQALLDEISQQKRLPTAIQTVSLPTARAFVELSGGNAEQALKMVEIRSNRLSRGNLWPTYVAGEAYLRLRSAAEARVEFQKILDHRGLDPLSPLQPLAKVGLARAIAASGDKEKGRKAYQDFFASWVNGDQDIPLLRRALSEYASLK